MTKWVNENSESLPDYELEVLWQNAACDSATGETMLMQNLFSAMYFPHDSPQLYDTKTVALLGPGCSGVAARVAMLARQFRVPAVSNSATKPSLSDRTRYPGFWRTYMPDTPFARAWLVVVKVLGFDEFAAVLYHTRK